jgi:hypothetical protein
VINGFPYWQFCNDRWLTGKVSSFDLDGQGLYLQFCMSAWAAHGSFNVCPTSIALRFRKDGEWVEAKLKAMLAVGILTRDGEQYRIKFIDDQLADLDALRAKRSKAGRASAESKHNTEVKNTIEEKSSVLPSVQQVLNTCSTDDAKTPRPTFQKPKIEEVKVYCQERKNNVDAQKWFDHYTSNGWKVGKNSMKDWRAAIRTWERSDIGKDPLQARTDQAKRESASRKPVNMPASDRLALAQEFAKGRTLDAFLDQGNAIRARMAGMGYHNEADAIDVIWKGRELIENR